MDKPFHSVSVRLFCDRYPSPALEAAAADCFDLRTLWYKADRPAWLLWLMIHSGTGSMDIFPQGWQSVTAHDGGDPVFQAHNDARVSVEDCNHLRSIWECPWRSTEPLPPCDPVPDGDLDHDVIGTRDASGTVTIDGRDYIPADAAQVEIATVAENRQYWVNVATFMLYGAYAGILVGYLLARLVRRQRNDARDCERGSEWLEVRG